MAMIIRECRRCGAPLVRVGNEMQCQYCGAVFDIPKEYQKGAETSFPINPVEFSKPVYSPQPSGVASAEPKKTRTCGLVLTMVLMFLGIAVAAVLLVPSLNEGFTGKMDQNSETEKWMYRANSSALPDENPADFIHAKMLSLGVIYNGRSSLDEFNMDVYVRNHTNSPLRRQSKSENLGIESLRVTDNNDLVYECSMLPYEHSDAKPGAVIRVAVVRCKPLLSPLVKFLNVHTQFTNWGDYDFQIPILLNTEKLNIEYVIQRHADGFNLQIWFFANPPQPVAIFYDDITVLDNTGKIYPLEYCQHNFRDLDSRWTSFYSTLAQSYQHGADISCVFRTTIPQEVNAVTVVITIQGKTFTMTSAVDTFSEDIFYKSGQAE